MLRERVEAFGGVPKTLNLDNIEAAVLKFDWADANLNPRFMDFAGHYQLAVLPCLPKTPEHKGKIENSLGYIKRNALANRSFASEFGQFGPAFVLPLSETLPTVGRFSHEPKDPDLRGIRKRVESRR